RALMAKYAPTAPPAYREADYKPLDHSYVSFEGFLDAKLLVEILKKGDESANKGGIRLAAESLKEADLGIDTPLSFNSRKHQALDRVYFTYAKDGRFITVDNWARWAK